MGWWIIAVPAGLFLLFLFLVAPRGARKRARAAQLGAWDYAHRGLHGGGVPENSLAAFQAAAEAGYGIEMDVRLTKDDQLVVFHDDSLRRMCGVEHAVEELPLSRVISCRLQGSGESIPTLDAALACVSGRVPLIIEMKSDPKKRKLLPAMLLERMRDYRGSWCVESFDPRMLRAVRKQAPQVLCGQLAFDPARLEEGAHRGAKYWFAARLLMNFLSRPDFISYDHLSAGNLCYRMMRALFHPVTAMWTVRSKEDYEKLKPQCDLQIFESFHPSETMMTQEEKEITQNE